MVRLGLKFCLPLCYSSTISIILGKLKSNYGSLMVALFFVAASLLGFSFAQKTDTIRENGPAGAFVSGDPLVDIAPTAHETVSLSAPSTLSLSTTTAEGTKILSLSTPEVLSLGEVKDPGIFTNVGAVPSRTVAYEPNIYSADARAVAFHYSQSAF
jgi:hypothetical protein